MVPHHGHYDDALADFVTQVDPAIAVVSGEEGDCDPDTADVFKYRGVPLWITGRDGAIIITVREGRAKVLGYKSGRSMEFVPATRGGSSFLPRAAKESEE